MEKDVPKINQGFVNKNGIYFSNVREVAYKSEELYGNLGTLVAQTTRMNDEFFKTDSMEFDLNGVYIYQNNIDPKIAYRIYKEYAEYKFNGYQDDMLINELQNRQKYVLKTNFPTGVVTKDGLIIGQEIPFYEHYKTLEKYVEEITSYEQLFTLYNIVISILEELKKCGITYIDVHAKNFMVYKNNTKLIDFESCKIKFDENKYLEDSLLNLRNMLNLLNQKLFISYRFEKFINYRDALKQVEQMRKSLKIFK